MLPVLPVTLRPANPSYVSNLFTKNCTKPRDVAGKHSADG